MSVDASSAFTLSTSANGSKKYLVVIILGGGIVGTSLAAMLAATGSVRIILIDPAKPGHGISSTNHGRAHSGLAWNPPANIDEAKAIMKRNEESRRLLNRLPNIWESKHYGLYCAASPLGSREFRQFLTSVGKESDCPLATDAHMVKRWINPDDFNCCFQVPEMSFAPATTSDRLLRYAVSTQRCSFVEDYADRLDAVGSRFRVTLLSGEQVEGDSVINCLGSWHNTLNSDLPLRPPKLLFNSWRLMALNSDSIGEQRLDRIITIDRSHTDSSRSEGPLAAIPHGGWVILGKDLVAHPMQTPDELLPGEDWRTLDWRHRMDRELFESHAEYFPVLKRLYDSKNLGSLFTFPGVYPEFWSTEAVERSVTGVVTPYRVKTSWIVNGVPGYMSLLGGSATSALANAKDACFSILGSHSLDTSGNEDWIERIAAGIPKEGNPSMIWDYHRAPFVRLAA